MNKELYGALNFVSAFKMQRLLCTSQFTAQNGCFHIGNFVELVFRMAHVHLASLASKSLLVPTQNMILRSLIVAFQTLSFAIVAQDEVLEKDGWFHTGDVVELLPNSAIKIIDRKKNIFKLSQGEYIAVEKLEAEYKKVVEVNQIWVYGARLNRHCAFDHVWACCVGVPRVLPISIPLASRFGRVRAPNLAMASRSGVPGVLSISRNFQLNHLTALPITFISRSGCAVPPPSPNPTHLFSKHVLACWCQHCF